MNKTHFVYGPQGSGKTRHAEQLRQHFGLDHVVDDWLPGEPFPTHGALVLTHMKPPREVLVWGVVCLIDRRCFHIDEALLMAAVK